MRSIRRLLLFWFLLGLGVLWIGAGIAVYYSYRAGLLAGSEAEVLSLLREVRVNQVSALGGGPATRGPGRGGGPHGELREGIRANSTPFGPDIYWQVWSIEDGETTRSKNLTGDLPQFETEPGATEVRSVVLENGISAMVASSRFGLNHGDASPGGGRGRRGGGPGGRGGPVEITVAKDLAGIHRDLTRALVVILLSGVAVAAAAAVGVYLLLRKGLAPLRVIGDGIATVDAGGLGERFVTDGLPDEVLPIVSRLNELMGRLEKSFTRERRFSSDLAHEMRTPVTELRIQAESALKWPEERGKEAWESVLGSVDRMEMVVQAMLQLARLEQAADIRSDKSLGLRGLVEEIWVRREEAATSRGLKLRLSVDPGLEIDGDPALWRLLLGNLVGNAVDYADQGSEVSVTTRAIPVGDAPVIFISNAARRLAQEDLDHLFDRFWRGDKARSSATHSGLGLALARACAEAMGWSLQARLRSDDGYLEMRIEPKKVPAG